MEPFKTGVVTAPSTTEAATPAPAAMADVSATDAPAAIAPTVAAGIEVAYLDAAAPWAKDVGADPTGTVLAPAAAVTVQLLYDEVRADVAHNETYEAVIFPLDGLIDVEDVLAVDHDDRDFRAEAPAGASYQLGNTKLQNKTFWTSLRSGVKNYLAANRSIEIWKCPGLKLYSRVDETEENFRKRCEQVADQSADIKVSQLRERFGKRIDRLQDQISSADARVVELEVDASSRTQAEVMSGVGDLLGGLLRGRMSSRTLSRAASRRAASKKAKVRLATAKQKADAKRRDLIELERDLEDELISIQNEFDALASAIEPLEIGLEKTDIRVAEAKLVWIPVS